MGPVKLSSLARAFIHNYQNVGLSWGFCEVGRVGATRQRLKSSDSLGTGVLNTRQCLRGLQPRAPADQRRSVQVWLVQTHQLYE